MIQSEKSSSRHSAYVTLVTLMETWLESSIEFVDYGSNYKLSWMKDCLQFERYHRKGALFYVIRFRRSKVYRYCSLETYQYHCGKVLWSYNKTKSAYTRQDLAEFFEMLPVIPQQFLEGVNELAEKHGINPLLKGKEKEVYGLRHKIKKEIQSE